MESQYTDNLKVGLSEESELKEVGLKEDSVENAVTQGTDVTVSTDSIPISETEEVNKVSIEPMDTSCEALEANRYEDVEMPKLSHEPSEERSEDVDMPKLDQEPQEEVRINTSIDNNIEEVKGFHIDQQQFEFGESQSDENNTNESCGNEVSQVGLANFEKFDINEIPAVDTNNKNTISEEEKQDSSIEACNFKDPVETIGIKHDQESLNRSESAFQNLSNLGVTGGEQTIEESKESLLQKLASRGAISITPSSGGSGNSSSRSLSITTSALSVQKPGTKSAGMKQKSKKIKIDPGKSSDIDKDFDSLINFLSANNTEKDQGQSESNQLENDTPCTEILKPEVDNVSESCLEQKKDELNGVVQETINNDEMVVHDMDTESHDGSKISHSSDQAEDDEQILITSSQPKNAVEEGSAEILLQSKNVFYNKVQEFNRDMSIAALTVFSEMHQQDPRTRNKGKKRKASDSNESESSNAIGDNLNVFEPGKKSENGITILEALSATGLRSIRYAREIPGVKEIIANDLSEDAVESIKKNIEHNGVEDLVSTTRSDASFLMYKRQSEQQWYDAIDLDPYGCPSRFLDSAVQVVRDGGLLLVTCTDMAVLAGNSPETCHAKYGAVSLRSPACHEMAIRIALQCIESHANRYGRYTVPLLSFSADFYIRIIVQVYTSPVTCKKTTSKLSMVFQCTGCQTHTFQPLGVASQENANTQPKFSLSHSPVVNTNCFHCHHKHHMGGPIWTAPIYNSKFVENMLRVVENGRFGTSKRMQGMLEVIREELPDTPLYYTISGLCSRLHCTAIPLIDIRSAILNAGYRVSSSHAAPTAIKTNAPSKIIWDIMRCWVHMNPVSQKRLAVGSVPASIIMEPPTLIANFDIHPKARPSSSVRKLLRYQQNPEKNWGPGMRARVNNSEDAKDEKRRLNQNKNKNKTPAKKTVEIIEVVTIDDDEEAIEEVTEPVTETAGTTSVS